MATEVIMPALGVAQETGRILQWFKSEGDAVLKGEPLLEIETDKVTVEIESPTTGVLARIITPDDDDIPVGQVIAVILAADEEEIIASPELPEGAYNAHVELVFEVERIDDTPEMPTPSALPARSEPRLTMASPKARRLASEQGLTLESIKGSGPLGAVLAADVLAIQSQTSQSLPMSAVWRIMAERTTQSWTSVPHFSLIREVNATQLTISLAEVRQRFAEKITYSDLLVKLVAAALSHHPRLNASWQQGAVILNQQINIGLAVVTEPGLVVPVIQQADKLNVGSISHQRQELVAAARDGKLRPEHIQGGTFTISNLGMYGVDAFNAIINPPQAAILAVGRIADRVVPINGQPAVQPMMVLTLSCDHRVVDGARGAQFLDDLARTIESPSELR